MDKSSSFQNIVGGTSGGARPPSMPIQQMSPEHRALAETVRPMVPHQDRELLELNEILFEACEDREFELIKATIESGADPNFFVTHPEGPAGGRIPVLAFACLLGRTDLVECLLEHGATATFWMLLDALVPEREAVIRTFAEHVKIDTPSPRDGSTLLHWACSTGNVWAVELLIKLDADFNKRMKDGATCLILAVEQEGVDRQQQLKIIKTLLAAGANIEARFRGVGPLACACLTDNVEAVSLLLAHGANPNARVGRNLSPLYVCCDAQVSVEIFARLVDGGARMPLEVAFGLIGDGDDSMSVRKRNCLAMALLNDAHRPVNTRYFIS
jgi:ankyrin repeat protein